MEKHCVNLLEQAAPECSVTRNKAYALKFCSPNGNGNEAGPAYHLARQLKDALVAEMHGYFGLLALLVGATAPNPSGLGDPLLNAMANLQKQLVVLASARQQREFMQAELAQYLKLPQDAPLAAIIPHASATFRPALTLLLRQNHRILQQAQQNIRDHISSLSRGLESVQSLRQKIEGWSNFPQFNSL